MRCKNFNILRHFVLTAFLVFIFAPGAAYGQGDPVLEAPDTLEETRERAVEIADAIISIIPKAIARIWGEQVIPVWRTMGEWVQAELWEKRISPGLQTASDTIQGLLGKEVEKRREAVQEGIQKQKEQIETELRGQTQKTKQSIWERFKALLRN